MAEPSDYRTRILDAAEACLMEQRMSAPLHARIAERAGVSRPTVYKYIGDQDDLVRAVLERVAAQYALAILPELERPLPLADHFAHLTGFSVMYFRASPVVAAIIEHDGDHFLSWITSAFKDIVRDGVAVLVPLLHERMPSTRDRDIPLEEILEWGVRLTLGLVFLPSAFVKLDTAEQIRDYVRRFVGAFDGTQQR